MSDTVQLRPAAHAARTQLPVVLVVAGSDSSGGAGIEADLKTLSAHKVYGATCIAAITVQNTQGVRSIVETSGTTVRGILDAVMDDFGRGGVAAKNPLRVIKTGMLTPAALAELAGIRNEVDSLGIRLVVDPVMVSTSGARLMSEGSMASYLRLISGSFLVTPNYLEALALAEAVDLKSSSGQPYDQDSVKSIEDGRAFVLELRSALKCDNLLLKGGHLPRFAGSGERRVYDFLDHNGKVTVYESHYIDSKDNHGSGCTLASALAAHVASNRPVDEAVPLALDYIHQAMSNFEKLGHGNGPLNHTVVPCESVDRVLTSSKVPVGEILQGKTLFEYLTQHPKVRDGWKRYTEHPFLELLATNRLQFSRFLYYLKQDYYYLINYAQIHGLAAGVAPSYKHTKAQADIIGSVVAEIERHKQKLCDKYHIDYDRDGDLDIELHPGPACLAYCDYLINISRNEDFLGIKVALAPCLHGYYEAGIYGNRVRKSHDGSLGVLSSQAESDIYDSWLADYHSDWYTQAHKEGMETIDALVRGNTMSVARMDELVKVFLDVVELEIGFWDEVIDQ